MKKRKQRKLLFMIVLLMMIGFASITTTLVLNGTLNLLGDTISFDGDVVFTKARTDTGGMASILENGKKITFTSKELSKVSDVSTLNFEITNKNRQYDAVATINCNTSTEEYADYITITPNKTSYEIEAGKSVLGSLSASLVRGIETEEVTDVAFTCNIIVTASERESVGEEYIEKSGGTIKKAELTSICFYGDCHEEPVGEFWDFRSSIKKVVFEDTMNLHETTEDLIFDVSENQDESVMSYLVLNEDNSAYTLYIQSDGKIKANKDSSYMFSSFSSLEEMEGLDYFDTSNVTNMSNMFVEYNKITNLDLSSWDTSKVTNMSDMFSCCRSLINLNISTWNTSNVNDMNYMFGQCGRLTNLDISMWNTSNVMNMNHMFSYCSSLANLDISTWDTSKVTDMRGMFNECSSLTNLNISNIDFTNVSSYSYVFYRMADDAQIIVKDETVQQLILNLSSSDRPSSWTTENVIVKI